MRTFFVAPMSASGLPFDDGEVGELARLDAAQILAADRAPPPPRAWRPESPSSADAHVGEHLHLVVQAEPRDDLRAASRVGRGEHLAARLRSTCGGTPPRWRSPRGRGPARAPTRPSTSAGTKARPGSLTSRAAAAVQSRQRSVRAGPRQHQRGIDVHALLDHVVDERRKRASDRPPPPASCRPAADPSLPVRGARAPWCPCAPCASCPSRRPS